ncbi:MAG: hypothetical protein R8N23_07765 [Reichenbachiella sp.]|uniref:hypothetical protein n=1 Tax=Reichenbachiella sp. TaxID=2184521 RepID=UPI002967456D|nr:hypothetical protein [Reichenbachiella sp.]MDW3209747.1 hypothetical protein [Reichenbachiella sp.]
MENKKGWIGKLLTEFISVVFAVLLALGLNHWREANNDEKLAEKALVNIFLEIQANQKEVEAEIPSYDEQIAEVKVFKDAFDKGEGMPYSLGFNMPVLSRSAWNVANSTGAIKDFDLNMLMELSDIYTFQEMYHNNGVNYMLSMHSVDAKKDENAKAIVDSNYGQLKTFKHWSIQLSAIYQEFIKTYGSQYKELLPDSVLVE